MSLLKYPSRAQTSEILWKSLGVYDLEHIEGRVYASFKWALCSDRVKKRKHSYDFGPFLVIFQSGVHIVRHSPFVLCVLLLKNWIQLTDPFFFFFFLENWHLFVMAIHCHLPIICFDFSWNLLVKSFQDVPTVTEMKKVQCSSATHVVRKKLNQLRHILDKVILVCLIVKLTFPSSFF